ncbi:MAG: hypothetical protein OEW12_10440, partial [Deltaproteobacteria bacterium]|nr:hypothetical protein [Deltaproteobacteria bacterium]
MALTLIQSALFLPQTASALPPGDQPPQAKSASQAALRLTEEGVFSFAEELFAQQEYYRAISEYKRLIHYFPQGRQAGAARLAIAKAYLLGGEPGAALTALAAVEREGGQSSLAGAGDDIRFLKSVGWLDTGLDKPYPLREESIAAALGELKGISPAWPGQPAAAGFVAAMDPLPPLPEKSPWLAGGLSAVVPGAGSLYTGRYGEGAMVFFFTGLFAYATVTSIQSDQPALGAVFAFFTVAFYGGGIYAAANGAHKFNSNTKNEYLDEQRARFQIRLLPGGGSL